MPHKVKPMLAKLYDQPFDREHWIFEIKWDGYRAIAEVEKGEVNLYSRNGNSFNSKYSNVIKALGKIEDDIIYDGEIVVLKENGYADFQKLQNYDVSNDPNLVYYIFDILYLNGKDLTNLSLIDRKKILREILPENHHLRFSDHIEKNGLALFREAEKNRIEGLIAKNGQSIYSPGTRTNHWLKLKTSLRQEAIMAGFTAPQGSRKFFWIACTWCLRKWKTCICRQ